MVAKLDDLQRGIIVGSIPPEKFKDLDPELQEKLLEGDNTIEGVAHQLEPEKKYLIIFDKITITMRDVVDLSRGLHEAGVYGLCVVINGNPADVKIIEDNRKATEEKYATPQA